jgi:hypothetical protein
MLTRLGRAAPESRLYLVCSSDSVRGDRTYRNAAYFLGRDRREIGRYHRVSPTVHEPDRLRGDGFPGLRDPRTVRPRVNGADVVSSSPWVKPP